MREINVSEVEELVRDLCIKANLYLPEDMESCIECNARKEQSPVGKNVFADILDNMRVAREETIPICQDTGMAVIFMTVGQDVHFVGGSLNEAINKGVARGYTEGRLRCSIVSDPLERVNTGDNTPPVVHLKIAEGEKVEIMVAPKGFGSENMSQLKMMTPSVTEDEIVDWVVSVCAKAGSNPCPPIVIGVGIGGDFEKCAYLAKKALCRSVSKRNPKERYAKLEAKMLEKINLLGIGPQGFGGTQTCLAVNIEEAPTHIAGLPVSVNVGCHGDEGRLCQPQAGRCAAPRAGRYSRMAAAVLRRQFRGRLAGGSAGFGRAAVARPARQHAEGEPRQGLEGAGAQRRRADGDRPQRRAREGRGGRLAAAERHGRAVLPEGLVRSAGRGLADRRRSRLSAGR